MKIRTTALADGFAEYRTVDGDIVDRIAFDFYGTHAGTTEAVYDANPKLLKMDMILPAGVVIRLPPIAAKPQPSSQINLWD